ncbi:hypothetical protein Desdi_1335 [Desulfitobacterium dichloroeliminans LMG P-21439]|uniref:Uncharacterized protein n=1 Tax=Desulfitobacterium dichloroeliminans (strain LMG P-21439 / DCA1) TaxID=871963 RepID=L0F740_DESDL|nr:hypothetical protein [Desulfitobacterium dichloroeliminans]AGA68845.1 hypothetical protein Desdi_1335 [Desulfitobacterium dichloroeliminans LMG P-21439]UWG96018.1 hypothetical protein LPY66_14010 [Dehalobacter sp. DCM]
MKRQLSIFLTLVLLIFLFSPIKAYAEGDGNIDHGGGGMGSGTGENYWNSGDEGVRITVVRASDKTAVTTPIDFTNITPTVAVHFGKISKLAYTNGRSITPSTSKYLCIKVDIPLPRIISSGSGQSSIEEIKRYFCSEYVLMRIADVTGMNYDILINGEYKILLEPIAYMTFGGIKYALTATEAALFDQQLDGGLRSKMVSLSHKNLPLAMFLQTADLGYPAWSGSTTTAASDTDIISSLGLGIVRFNGAEADPTEVSTVDYEYRVNTDVITSVTVRGGQADPDHPVTVKFTIGGQTYTVSGVYYPSGDSQLVWVRWTTPATPQTMTIRVSVTGGGSASQGIITAKIIDLSGNDPPNPVADDRNNSYTTPSVPSKAQNTSASWGIWRPWWHANWVWISTGEDTGYWVDEGWWEFDWISYRASLSAVMSIVPDAKDPTASGKTLKSGYGINQTTTANVSTNQSSAVTDAQTAVTYFPESQYKTYWRLLEQTQSGYNAKFEFASNKYSTYNRRTHFTPIWFPDGSYTAYTWLIDCWTPAGMLSANLTDSVNIQGNLWSDWHIAPVKP